MTLYDICTEIAEIEDGLYYGDIDFSYDNLMSAMKPGHPADILDDILSLIGEDVSEGKTPDITTLWQTLSELREFKKAFKVKQVSEPIKHLKEYIENTEKENRALKQKNKKIK